MANFHAGKYGLVMWGGSKWTLLVKSVFEGNKNVPYSEQFWHFCTLYGTFFKPQISQRLNLFFRLKNPDPTIPTHYLHGMHHIGYHAPYAELLAGRINIDWGETAGFGKQPHLIEGFFESTDQHITI